MSRLPVALLALPLLLLAGAAGSQAAAPGAQLSVPATVERVIDGDTVVVRAHPWPRLEIRVSVRLAAVDAPELRGRCPEEREIAARARDWVRERLPAGSRVRLVGVREGKYAGRVVARLVTEDGLDLARGLLEEGLARPYHGGRRRPWCP